MDQKVTHHELLMSYNDTWTRRLFCQLLIIISIVVNKNGRPFTLISFLIIHHPRPAPRNMTMKTHKCVLMVCNNDCRIIIIVMEKLYLRAKIYLFQIREWTEKGITARRSGNSNKLWHHNPDTHFCLQTAIIISSFFCVFMRQWCLTESPHDTIQSFFPYFKDTFVVKRP